MSRLEKIKEFYKDDRETAEHAGVGLILGDYDWLIKQAERVEELEKDNKALEDVNEANYWAGNEIKFENLRYKQALEEIAKDTGTPYADIAIKALAGDKDD